ncbi:MAG: YkvA family protein [Myxococcota bacterium]
MAELKVTFKLSDRDVQHLRRIMRKASAAAKTQDEESIIKAAMAMASEVRRFKPPQYVLERVHKLETLVEMLQDKQYALPGPVRRKILSALCYFSHPADLIPDTVPGLGFLDDAIMIELMVRELKHELGAYRDFCRFRDSAEQRPWTRGGGEALERELIGMRKKLRARVEERTRRDAEKVQTGGKLLRLW